MGRSENICRYILDANLAGVIAVEAETGRLSYANLKAAELLGYGPGELENINLTDLMPKSNCETALSEIEKLAEGRKFLLTDFLLMKKNNHICRTDIYGTKTYVREASAHVLFLTDADQRKGMDEAIRQSEEKFRTMLDSIGQGYYETDLKGNFTFLNASLCHLLGYSESALLGMNFRHIMVPENAEKLYDIFKKVYETEIPDQGFVWEYVRTDGAIRQIGSSVFPIRDADGRKIGFRGIARDISERKLTENQVAQNQKLESIGRLAAGIAHEINTPTQYVGDNIHFLKDAFEEIITILSNFEELIQTVRSGAIPEELLRGYEKAVEAADLDYLKAEIPLAISQSMEGLERVASIVSAMKEFSYPGGEEKSAIAINKAIAATITITRNEWKYVADMETDFEENLPPVPLLPDEFNQVILNMIINAAHAINDVVGDTGKKGTIRISTHLVEDRVEVRLSDTGPGIPKMIRPMIFDPFFTTKGIGKGTGQGLAISHAIIVKKHGGSIWFDTEMGKGTTFVISLPLFDNNKK